MNQFVETNPEDGDFNQYWYSPKTISTIVGNSFVIVSAFNSFHWFCISSKDALVAEGGNIAFLSTPSIYFSIPESLRSQSKVFDVSFSRLYSYLSFDLL